MTTKKIKKDIKKTTKVKVKTEVIGIKSTKKKSKTGITDKAIAKTDNGKKKYN